MSEPKKVILDILTVANTEKALNSAVMDYITIKRTIQDLESQLNVQKSIIMDYAKDSGIHGIKFMEDIINYIPEIKYSQLNKDRLKLELLNAGVDAKIISKCEELAQEEKVRVGYLRLDKTKKRAS